MRAPTVDALEIGELERLLLTGAHDVHPFLEERVKLRSLEHWSRWKQLHADRGAILEAVAAAIRAHGFIDPILGRIAAGEFQETGALREGLVGRGVNSRQRAVLRALSQREARLDSRIYATEAVTPLALRLRGVFPYFLGSEYAADQAARESMFPIPHQDLTCLELPAGSFDFVITNEVLEHVPDMDAALRSIARVVKPGGWHVGTVPFHYESRRGIVRARVMGGKVEHLMEPEYHGNPFQTGGSLVFELPGWDIIDRAIQAGFSEACMEFTWSANFGILAEELGVFLLILRR